MFLATADRPNGEPLFCRGCNRPIDGPDADGYHPACERPFKSIQRALDMLQRGWG